MKAIASNISLSGDLTFSNNTAYTGTAFILLEDSIVIVAEDCQAYFVDNYATNTEGVFSIFSTLRIITQHDCPLFTSKFSSNYVCQVTISTCFLRTQVYRHLTANFIFANNSAGKGGDIVYGGSIPHGFTGYQNCIDTLTYISNISETSFSLISSDPLRVCLCNQSGLPDCMLLFDSTTHFIYPGQTISIYAVVVGQNWGTVAGSVYAQFLFKYFPQNRVHHRSFKTLINTHAIFCNTQYSRLRKICSKFLS